MRGAFIVIEGIDGSGKTTQCRLLAEHMASLGAPVERVSFPDRGTPVGKLIDGYLRGEEHLDPLAAHMLFVANRWELCESLRAKLLSGTSIIADRYSFSGAAYTVAHGRASVGWCMAHETGLVAPDAVAYLEIDASKVAERDARPKERYHDPAFLGAVARVFDDFRQREDWFVVDADRAPEAVCADICPIAYWALSEARFTPTLRF